MQGEEFILILMRQTNCHSAFVDQVKLRKVFSSFHNCLVSNENSTVESRNEKCEEFSTSVLFLWGFKQMIKVVDHRLEELSDEFISEVWLKLVKEVEFINKFLMVIEE